MLDAKKDENTQRKESINLIINETKEQIKLNGLKEQQKKIVDQITNLSPQIKIAVEGNATKDKESETERILKKLVE